MTRGAGIVPLIVEDDQLFFLFSRESYVPKWKQSNKWSTFSGASKCLESQQDTACREFMEESMNIWDMKYFDDRYILKVKTVSDDSDYVIWIQKFSKYKEQINKFKSIRMYYCKIMTLQNKLFASRRELSLMQDAVNFPFLNSFVQVYDKMIYVCSIVSLHIHDHIVYVKFTGDCCGKFVTSELKYDAYCKATLAYIRWFNYSVQINTYAHTMYKLCPSAINFRSSGCVCSVLTFNKEYLEKDFILPWTVDEIFSVVQNNIFTNHLFKRAFVPILYVIIEKFHGSSFNNRMTCIGNNVYEITV